jgi:hypothetical protein
MKDKFPLVPVLSLIFAMACLILGFFAVYDDYPVFFAIIPIALNYVFSVVFIYSLRDWLREELKK